MFINNLIIGGNKMETNDYFANVIVVDLVNNKNYFIAIDIDAKDAVRIAVSINKEITLTGNDNKVIVRVEFIDKVNTIQVYKNVVDKVLEIIDNTKRNIKNEDCIEQHKHIESCEEIVEKAAKVAKEAAKIAEDAAKECKIKLKRDKYIKNR